MKPDRPRLLHILTQLEQAESAALDMLRLDAGASVDVLAEALINSVESIRGIVQELLRD